MTNADIVRETLAWLEKHLREELPVPSIAAKAGYSRHHFSRMFSALAGMPLKEYVLRRKLTEAAKSLSAGRSTITDVALAFGFGDVDTFARALKREYGVTPSAVRRGAAIVFQEPIDIAPRSSLRGKRTILTDSRIELSPSFLIAGWTASMSSEHPSMSRQWECFARRAPLIDGRVDPVRLRQLASWREEPSGPAIRDLDRSESIELLSGVVMSTLDRMDIDLTGRAVPECTCLVFTHAGPVDRIPDSYVTIYGELLPVMDHRPSLSFNYEDYSAYANDPNSDETCFDIYIPISS